MKKSSKLIIIIIVLLLLGLIGFKTICYFKYNISNLSDVPVVKITGNMTINHEELDESEYIKFNDIKFKDVFDDYENKSDGMNSYILKKEDENKAVLIGSDAQLISMLNGEEEYSKVLTKEFEKENITDDIKLLRYMENHNEDKVNYFMTTYNQKLIYSLREFESVILPSIKSVKTIDGYYNGYIFNTTESINEINIIFNNNRYYFTFIGDFSEEFIGDFMNSVIVGNNNSSEEEEKEDVSLRVNEFTLSPTGATFILFNDSDNEYWYGPSFMIEKKSNGKWTEVPTKNGEKLLWTTEVYKLGPNEKSVLTIDWSNEFGELPNGEYRFGKTIIKSENDSESNKKNIYVKFGV